mmetsp:Transcript_30042/g.57692  ORF Transcript_30042/g.57692 Transcript_30042/m.57692 type:complete len:93 (+) Transcript_30042:1470-1748(+)
MLAKLKCSTAAVFEIVKFLHCMESRAFLAETVRLVIKHNGQTLEVILAYAMTKTISRGSGEVKHGTFWNPASLQTSRAGVATHSHTSAHARH